MKKLLALCLVIILFSSCSSTNTVDQIPIPLQNVSGYVILYNEFGQLQQNYSGVTVTMNGNYTSATDTAGKFFVKYVPTGYYTVTYSKSGYGTYSLYNYEYLSGKTLLPTANLYANSTTTLSGLTAKATGSSVEVTGALDPVAASAEPRGVILFTSLSNQVSPDYYTQAFFMGKSTAATISYTFNPYSYYPKGQTIYFVAYGISDTIPFINSTTGQLQYTSLGPQPSNLASVVAP